MIEEALYISLTMPHMGITTNSKNNEIQFELHIQPTQRVSFSFHWSKNSKGYLIYFISLHLFLLYLYRSTSIFDQSSCGRTITRYMALVECLNPIPLRLMTMRCHSAYFDLSKQHWKLQRNAVQWNLPIALRSI